MWLYNHIKLAICICISKYLCLFAHLLENPRRSSAPRFPTPPSPEFSPRSINRISRRGCDNVVQVCEAFSLAAESMGRT